MLASYAVYHRGLLGVALVATVVFGCNESRSPSAPLVTGDAEDAGTAPPDASPHEDRTSPDSDAGDAAAAADTRCGTPPAAVQCPSFLMTFDDVYRAILADVQSQPAEDRPFLRYLGLVNRRNAGVCGAALDVERWALAKILNSISLDFAISLPNAIDVERTLYRVDLRRYGWDRTLDVEGVSFLNAWEAIVANDPYALEFEGDTAAAVHEATQTSLPYTSADAFLDTVSVGNLYYALIGVPIDRTIDDFVLEQLGIDVFDALDRGLVKGAGFRGSSVSRQPRVAHRYPFAADRAYWQIFDFSNDFANESIFDDPFGFSEGGTHAIYSLPNLLPAYLAADENGAIIEQSAILFANNAPVVVGLHCMECHVAGVLPLRDQVRAYVDANPTNYNTDEAEAIQSLFVVPEELDALIDADRAVYARTVAQLGIPADCPDPVGRVQRRFSQPLTLRDALGDLGVSQEAFEAARAALEPSVAGLLNVGQLERQAFAYLFVHTLCAVNAAAAPPDAGFGRVAPAQAICDSAVLF